MSSVRPEYAYKHWYYLPEGPEGPVLYRVEQWDRARNKRLAWVVQNATAKYMVNAEEGAVRVVNYGVLHGVCKQPRVPTIPTDPADLCDFIQELEGGTGIAMANRPGLAFQRDPKTGWVSSSIDTPPRSDRDWTTRYTYTPFDRKVLNAPACQEMKCVDLRDPWFKQGWGFVRVQGKLHGLSVSGFARLPYVYQTCATHSALLKLQIGSVWTLVDNEREAMVVDRAGRVVRRYAGGSFFLGWPRPWLGFEPLDLVRRDCARQRLWFSNALEESSGAVEWSFVAERDSRFPQVLAVYRFESRSGRLTSITYRESEGSVFDVEAGQLTFSYLLELPASADLLKEPDVPARSSDAECPPAYAEGVLWPVCLSREALQLQDGLVAHGQERAHRAARSH